MSLILELRLLLSLRLRFGDKDFNRVADLCLVLVVGAALYLYLTPGDEHMGLMLMQWSPMLFFPLALAQAYSAEETVAASSLFVATRLRRRRSVVRGEQPLRLNLLHGYFVLCLLAAGAANTRDTFFYPLVLVLSALALVQGRPRRHPLPLWLLCLILSGLLGYLGQYAIDEAQARVRGWARLSDAFRSITAIGDVSQLQDSDAIELRVAVDKEHRGTLLLRQAVYNFYVRGEWRTGSKGFSAVPQGGPGVWVLAEDPAAQRRLTIYHYFPRRYGLLPLPMGAARIAHLPAASLERSPLGTVKVLRTDGLIACQVLYAPGASYDEAPLATDQVDPSTDRELFATLAGQLGLRGLPPEDAIAGVRRFFASGFRYSTDPKDVHRSGSGDKPAAKPSARVPSGQTAGPSGLAQFMNTTRAGHCEYFATATALLLRAAGVPTRYVTGYLVQEFDPDEGLFVVRGNHAHAWVLAWTGLSWREVDTTPPVWIETGALGKGFWTRLSDLRSRLVFAFSRWRWLEDMQGSKRLLLLGTVPILLFLIYRIVRKHGIARARRPDRGQAADAPPQEPDAPFRRIEAHLQTQGRVRPASMPLETWILRLELPSLRPLLGLHYRARFDPRGLSADQQLQLARGVEQWLQEQDALPDRQREIFSDS